MWMMGSRRFRGNTAGMETAVAGLQQTWKQVLWELIGDVKKGGNEAVFYR